MIEFYAKARAFTLVEIMIVVLIIAILLAIAIPSFIQTREISRATSCVANLKQIESAKAQWAMDTKAAAAATPTAAALTPAYIKSYPSCPYTGTYTINNISTNPSCSIGASTINSNWSHVLP